MYKCETPAQSAETSRDELLSFYRTMVRIRKMELTADSLYKQKLIRGFCHLYNGQVGGEGKGEGCHFACSHMLLLILYSTHNYPTH